MFDGSTDLNDTPPDSGRFENGEIKVGFNKVSTLAVDGNGKFTIRRAMAGGINIPFSITQGTLPPVSGNVVSRSGGSPVFKLHITGGALAEDYIGGRIDIAGTLMFVANVDTVPSTVTVQEPSPIPFEVVDDDQLTVGGVAMLRPSDTTIVPELFDDAYIVPVVDGGGDFANNNFIPFDRNVDVADMLSIEDSGFQSKNNRSNDYWVIWILQAYQSRTTRDNDPNSETALGGEGTPDGSSSRSGAENSGIFIYIEELRDEGVELGIPFVDEEQRSVGHEFGHPFGLSNTGLTGIMGPLLLQAGNQFFQPFELGVIRSNRNPGTPGSVPP